MIERLMRSVYAPWAGLFLGALGWFVHQQGSSEVNTWDCRLGGMAWSVGLAVLCALVVAWGGWISWTSRRRPEGGPEGVEARGFAGLVSAGAALVFLLAVAFQTLAGLIVPSCLR